MKAEISKERCLGYGECCTIAPHLFRLRDDNFSEVIDDPAAWQDEAAAKAAAANCPTGAIRLRDA